MARKRKNPAPSMRIGSTEAKRAQKATTAHRDDLDRAIDALVEGRQQNQGKVRVQLYVGASDLARIDTAAEASGESRSEYMMKAALMRSGEAGSLFSEAERKELQAEMRWEAVRVVAEFNQTLAKAALKVGSGNW